MVDFKGFFVMLEGMGMLDVLLPFLLLFTISFAVLQKSRILGPDSKRFNSIVAFVLAMAAIIPHVIGKGPDVVTVINAALPQVSLVMIAAMMALLLIGVFGNDINIAGTPLAGPAVLLSIIAVIYIFAAEAFGGLPSWLNNLLDPQTRSAVIALVIFGVIVWYITKEEGGEYDPNKRTAFKDFFNGLGGVMGPRNGGDHHH